MKCDLARLDVDSYADGEFSAWRRFIFSRHLATCPACAARVAEARSLRERSDLVARGLLVPRYG